MGSGKSSVLMSVLSEIPVYKGEVKVRGKVSYARFVKYFQLSFFGLKSVFAANKRGTLPVLFVKMYFLAVLLMKKNTRKYYTFALWKRI